jgi:hypothetical protein
VASFDEVIPPGKAGTIKASIHTASLRGTIAKGLTVTHDDPTQGPIALSVKANVVGSVELLPMPIISLAPRVKGSAAVGKVIVRKETSESGTLAVSGITSSAPWMKVTQRVVTAPEPAVDGLPDAKPGDTVLLVDASEAPVGSYVETLTFSTGLPREKSVSLPVRVTVRGPLIVQPRELLLNPDPMDPTHATGQLLAAVREDLDPKKIAFATDSPAFTLKTEPSGERGYKVTVDWKKTTGKEPTEGTISLSVGDEVTKVPVRVNLAMMGAAVPAAPAPAAKP